MGNLWFLEKNNMGILTEISNSMKFVEKKMFRKIWNICFKKNPNFLIFIIKKFFFSKFNASGFTTFHENFDLNLFSNLLKICKKHLLKFHQNNFLFLLIFKKSMPFYHENIEILIKR